MQLNCKYLGEKLYETVQCFQMKETDLVTLLFNCYRITSSALRRPNRGNTCIYIYKEYLKIICKFPKDFKHLKQTELPPSSCYVVCVSISGRSYSLRFKQLFMVIFNILLEYVPEDY